MAKPLHVVLKYKKEVEISRVTFDTISEHKIVFEKKNKLVWGQFSKGNNSGVGEDKRKRISD